MTVKALGWTKHIVPEAVKAYYSRSQNDECDVA